MRSMIAEGSSKEYLELIAELRTLKTALLEVKSLDLAVEQQPQRAALRQAARQYQIALTASWRGSATVTGAVRLASTSRAPPRPAPG